jgi:AcrR family transcriptional regulator
MARRAPIRGTPEGTDRMIAPASHPLDADDRAGLQAAQVQAAHERVADMQRARMMAAMAEVCAERGVANVTVAHVVARAGVSRRTFYEQFSDREECFLAALDEAIECAERRVLPAFVREERWRRRVGAALLALLEFLDDEPHMAGLLIVESLGAGERALARRRQVLERVHAAVDEGRCEARGGAALPPLTPEAAVGGVLSVLHSRLCERNRGTLVPLAAQLTSMLVLPYVGSAAAARELRRPVPSRPDGHRPVPANPLRDLEMRLTYRTVRVLLSIADRPNSSNRELALVSGVSDQGQMSKLLMRLEKLGLVENVGAGHARGGPNAWTLTPKGEQVRHAIAQQAGDTNGR